jgi:hypothetical protein
LIYVIENLCFDNDATIYRESGDKNKAAGSIL